MVGGAKPTFVPSSFSKMRGEFPVSRLDPLEALEKIDVKEGAAKLAVGDPLQAHILLRAHDFANARVLDCVQFGGGEAAGGETLARFPQPLRAEKAPDMVGAKRRTGHRLSLGRSQACSSCCHDDLRFGNQPVTPNPSPHRCPEEHPSLDGLWERGRSLHRLAAKNAFSIAAASLSRKPP